MNTLAVLSFVVAVALGAPEAPYAPSGWRPQGQQFNLPARQYGSPSQEYGPVDGTTDVPTTTVEPDSEDTNNSSRFSRFPNRVSAQLNQASGQFFIIAADGSIQHVAIPTPRNRQRQEPESELVSSVDNAAPLGQLVRLTSAPIRQSAVNTAAPLGQIVRLTSAPIRQAPVDSTASLGQLVRLSNAPVRQVSPQSSRSVAASQRSQPTSLFRVSERQQAAPTAAGSSEFFALTSDGRLQRLDARSASSAKLVDASVQTPAVSTVVLTPEGRFERLQLQPVKAAEKEENGQYHLLLPSGQVQRVQYMNLLSPENRLTSNVQYDEVAPINGPVYTYGSPLVRVV